VFSIGSEVKQEVTETERNAFWQILVFRGLADKSEKNPYHFCPAPEKIHG
jgi:hypothetical protein